MQQWLEILAVTSAAALTIGVLACGGGEEGGEEGGVCSNSCTYAFDGECDDGGPNSLFNLCAYGTDCGDCGSRPGEGGGGGGGVTVTPTERPCFYTYRSRLACPGTPDSRTGPEERCAMVSSLEECRERFESDVDCFSGCCSDTTYSGHRLGTGSCQ
jgi:hypothetical protein